MDSISKGYKVWIVASVTVLVGSLVLLATVVVIGFMNFSQASTPLWLIVFGVLAMLGVGAGFAGFFLMMMAAGWKSFREARRVQVIPPPHGDARNN